MSNNKVRRFQRMSMFWGFDRTYPLLCAAPAAYPEWFVAMILLQALGRRSGAALPWPGLL
jgi:hypothetical protein